MARLTVGEKAERVLVMLMGLRSQRVAEALTRHGFTEQDLDEGWRLLRKVTRTQLDGPPATPPTDPDTLEQLDKWESRWFAIANATLFHRAPETRAWLFRNLTQTEGVAVAVSVATFLERIAQLKSGAPGIPADAPAAVKALEARGLNADVIAAAEKLIERLRKVEAGSAFGQQPSDEELAEAESELWAWYLEWSQIARTAIKQRALLKALGFLQTDRPRKGDDGGEDPITPEIVKPAA